MVILAHNYQAPEVQDIADYLGDSLDLCYRAQESYRQFLLETTAETDLEVTGYAHRKFERYLSLNRPESGERSPGKYTAPHSLALRNAREIWMEESFCETVAMLVVPDYKSDEDWAATIDLAMRQVSIAQVTKLKL